MFTLKDPKTDKPIFFVDEYGNEFKPCIKCGQMTYAHDVYFIAHELCLTCHKSLQEEKNAVE